MTGGEPQLTPSLLLAAYRMGVFPMSESSTDPEVFWVEPRLRGIIPLDGLHVSQSLAKTIRRGIFTLTCDRAFAAVMRGCADRENTWINPAILTAYTELHQMGFAHSVECWQSETLVGGLYGVSIGSAFFGESMFSTAPDASKVALAHLVARLNAGGYRLLDTQFLTPHLARLGGIEIPRGRYKALLAEAIDRDADFWALDRENAPQGMVQRSIQTS